MTVQWIQTYKMWKHSYEQGSPAWHLIRIQNRFCLGLKYLEYLQMSSHLDKLFSFCWHSNIWKSSWYLDKKRHILSWQKRLEISHQTCPDSLSNISVLLPENLVNISGISWLFLTVLLLQECPVISSIKSGFVGTKMAENGPNLSFKTIDYVSKSHILVVDGCMRGLNLITSFRSVTSHMEKMICRILLFFCLTSCG